MKYFVIKVLPGVPGCLESQQTTVDRQPGDLLLEVLPGEHLHLGVNVGHSAGECLVVNLVDQRDDPLPGVWLGETEQQADAVQHAAAQPGLAEAEEHTVTHTPFPSFTVAVLKCQTPPELSSMPEHSKGSNILQSVRVDGLLGHKDAAECVFSELGNMTGELWAGQQVITGALRAFKWLSQDVVRMAVSVAVRYSMQSGQCCEGLHTVIVV